MIGYFKHASQTQVLVIALGLIALIGGLDIVTGPAMTVTLFYVPPVALAAWYASRRGLWLVLSFLTFVSVSVDLYVRHDYYPSHFVLLWNIVGPLLALYLAAFVFSELRQAYARAQEMALIDPLTGIPNRRSFALLGTSEIARMMRTRTPLSIAYFDLDHFKQVNDHFGHDVGDHVLQEVAQAARQSLRQVDVVARLGGDEFIVLLPDTDPKGALEAMSRLQQRITNLAQDRNWPIAASIGVVTYETPPKSVDEMVKAADAQMYVAKQEGRDRIEAQVVPAEPPTA